MEKRTEEEEESSPTVERKINQFISCTCACGKKTKETDKRLING